MGPSVVDCAVGINVCSTVAVDVGANVGPNVVVGLNVGSFVAPPSVGANVGVDASVGKLEDGITGVSSCPTHGI